jgi:hypothetical protein
VSDLIGICLKAAIPLPARPGRENSGAFQLFHGKEVWTIPSDAPHLSCDITKFFGSFFQKRTASFLPIPPIALEQSRLIPLPIPIRDRVAFIRLVAPLPHAEHVGCNALRHCTILPRDRTLGNLRLGIFRSTVQCRIGLHPTLATSPPA